MVLLATFEIEFGKMAARLRYSLSSSTFIPSLADRFRICQKSALSRPATTINGRTSLRIRVSADDEGGRGSSSSYLHMWKSAVERGRKEIEFQRIVPETSQEDNEDVKEEVDLEKKSSEFQKLLEVSKEERDRIQRMQVIDRAAAAIAAARSLLRETNATTSQQPHQEVKDCAKDVEGLTIDGEGGNFVIMFAIYIRV